MPTETTVKIVVPRPPHHLDALPSEHQRNDDRCRCVDPPSTRPLPIDQRSNEQDDGELSTTERAEGFSVQDTGVEGMGEVAFDEVKNEREPCGDGGDEDGGEGSGGVIVSGEGDGGSGDGSNSESNKEGTDGRRCNAFNPVKVGIVRCIRDIDRVKSLEEKNPK